MEGRNHPHAPQLESRLVTGRGSCPSTCNDTDHEIGTSHHIRDIAFRTANLPSITSTRSEAAGEAGTDVCRTLPGVQTCARSPWVEGRQRRAVSPNWVRTQGEHDLVAEARALIASIDKADLRDDRVHAEGAGPVVPG